MFIAPFTRGEHVTARRLNQLRDGVASVQQVVGEQASIGVTQTGSGTAVRDMRDPILPTGNETILMRITGNVASGTTGQKFRYGWQEVDIGGDTDDDTDVTDGLSGTTTVNFALNLCEINNTGGAEDTQGNGMELVAPVPTNAIVFGRAIAKRDGTLGYFFQYENSDHIGAATTVTIGSLGADGGSEEAEGTSQNFETDQTGKSDAGEEVVLRNVHRVGYFRDGSGGDSILYGYVRPLTIRPNGKIKIVAAETRINIETAVDC